MQRNWEIIPVPETDTVNEQVWMGSLRDMVKSLSVCTCPGGGTVHPPAPRIKHKHVFSFLYVQVEGHQQKDTTGHILYRGMEQNHLFLLSVATEWYLLS